MSFTRYNPSQRTLSPAARKYHVFLSFQGEDVRKTFVDHLYASLENAGVNAFLDSEKLEKGDEISPTILNAIQNSAIRIPIFSQNYAKSDWCLEEVSHMCKSSGHIIPLFYDVPPTEVRHPDRGAFAEAFQQKRRMWYPKSKINEWKKALAKVASFSGWSRDDTFGLVDSVVSSTKAGYLSSLIKLISVYRLLCISSDMEVTRTLQFVPPYNRYALFVQRDFSGSSSSSNSHLRKLFCPIFVDKYLDAKTSTYNQKTKELAPARQKRKILVYAASNSGASSQGVTPRNKVPLQKRGEKGNSMKTFSQKKSSKAMEELDFERGVCDPFRKYTPEMVKQKVLGSRGAVFSLIGRGVEILSKLGLYWITLFYDRLVGRGLEIVPLRAEQLRNLLCDLGPSFIKAGQVLANRPDIVRDDYMTELCILQDDVPSFPNKIAFTIIEEEVSAPLEQIFSKISSETIAAASLGQVYRATLRGSVEEVAIKVLRPEIEPIIYRDLFLFRTLASFLNGISLQKLGCNAELIVDEFGEKLLEELDYTLEARNIEDFLENFKDDPTVKIPRVYKELSGSRVLVMEWIDGIRCTDPQAIKEAGLRAPDFLTVGVSAALRQLLEFGLFHGDPHPGNIFAMRDGRIAYVDFGNVAVLSQQNKQILIDAVVHAVNEDYVEMANDFTRLGFLAPGTDVTPIVPALEAIWQNSVGKGLSDFNFRSVTEKFNKLVYQYPIRIPERFSLVIRSLLTQEGICFTLQPDFKFLEVAYPYVAKRLLTDPDPALRERLIQVLFKDGVFQWKRLENLIILAKEQVALMSRNPALQEVSRQDIGKRRVERKLDLTDTLKDGARVVIVDASIRRKLLLALTEDSKLHIQELMDIYRLVEGEFDVPTLALDLVQGLPVVTRDMMLAWSESVLVDR